MHAMVPRAHLLTRTPGAGEFAAAGVEAVADTASRREPVMMLLHPDPIASVAFLLGCTATVTTALEKDCPGEVVGSLLTREAF